VTSGAVEEIIERARARGEKAIIFVTGVPGAGKTLVGLNVATRRRDFGEARAVFLSGNGPLVAVLQEALTRDEMRRQGIAARKGAVRQQVKPFIQNVHHFRDEGIRNPAAPYDHVVIFDEAQRAWDRKKTADFMKRRKKIADFHESEAEFLISYLDRHSEWAVIICLVGGGQEIHTGEAGIAAWLQAVRDGFPHWQTYVSPDLTESEYAVGTALGDLEAQTQITEDGRLHLATSMRSFRSEKVSSFVKAILDCDEAGAREILKDVSSKYPIAITLDLVRAKRWIRDKARGSEQFGLVASSQAQRLKPHAIDVRVNVDPIHWFLADRTDTRSSYYLEDAATEFQVQGLELDWICVTWDADLRLQGRRWRYHSFRGDAWITLHKPERQRYLLNAYRVLLTRARQGMVLFVPHGDGADPTRAATFYDETYDYLAGLGIAPV
jgi:schlafen family protein